MNAKVNPAFAPKPVATRAPAVSDAPAVVVAAADAVSVTAASGADTVVAAETNAQTTDASAAATDAGKPSSAAPVIDPMQPVKDAVVEANDGGDGVVVTEDAQAKLEETLASADKEHALVGDLNPALADEIIAFLPKASPLTKMVINSLLQYVNETGPTSNLQPGAGARKQAVLFAELRNYINNAPEDFRKGFGTILRIFNDQQVAGVFSPRYLFRFVKEMNLSNKDRTALEYLFQGLVTLSDASSRATALKQVDLPKIGATALNENGTKRFRDFFAV